MSEYLNDDSRATRRTTALVVETAELRAAIIRMFEDGDMLSQMATLLSDGSAEYERAVLALRKVARSRSLADAKEHAQGYLRDID